MGSLVDDSIAITSVSAYVYRQAVVFCKMIKVFVDDWYKCLKTKSLGSTWLHSHPIPPSIKQHWLVSMIQLYYPTSMRWKMDPLINAEINPGTKGDPNTEGDSDTEGDNLNDIISANLSLLKQLLET